MRQADPVRVKVSHCGWLRHDGSMGVRVGMVATSDIGRVSCGSGGLVYGLPEGGHDLWVELYTAQACNFLICGFKGQCFSIGTVGCHGVQCIRNRKNPRR